jgi:NADPH-dependent 2,4-dienoyl-CoA reductase/sulfur reductase-like enzyme
MRVAVIGGGPAGLMAAEVLARGGAMVTVYDRMPSVGRKFLLPGTRRAISPTVKSRSACSAAMGLPSRACAPP